MTRLSGGSRHALTLILALAPVIAPAIVLPPHTGDDESTPGVKLANNSEPPVAKPAATPTTAPKAEPVPVAMPASPTMPAVASQPLTAEQLAQINASAKGLAGLAAGGAWETTPEWKKYSASLDGQWRYLDEERLKAMRAWQATELVDLHEKSSTVFYPFSGPDVLYADTLFPNSKILLMAGLEPVGTVPDLTSCRRMGNWGRISTRCRSRSSRFWRRAFSRRRT